VNYTILMAFNERAGVNYTNVGYGRMWSSSKEEEAFEFGGQWMTLSGQATDEEKLARIGAKGMNTPVEVLYHNDDADAPSVMFKGLATFEKNGECIFSYVGIAQGENFYPARFTKKIAAEQGLDKASKPRAEERVMEDWQPPTGHDTIATVYYPQPCYVDEENMDSASALKPAHFYGTFTTRFNASLSTKAPADWEKVPEFISGKAPK